MPETNLPATQYPGITTPSSEKPFIGTSFPGSTLMNGLVSYWSMDGYKDLILPDKVGSNHLGSIGGFKVQTAQGINGDCAHFTGIGDGFFKNNVVAPASWTVAVWVKKPVSGYPGSATFAMGLVTHISAANCELYLLDNITTWNIVCITTNDAAGNIIANYASQTAVPGWHQVVATFDNAGDRKIRLYFDNVLRNTSAALTGTIHSAAGQIAVGAYIGPGTSLVDQDSTGFWSRVLSDSELAELYNNGSGKFFPFLA